MPYSIFSDKIRQEWPVSPTWQDVCVILAANLRLKQQLFIDELPDRSLELFPDKPHFGQFPKLPPELRVMIWYVHFTSEPIYSCSFQSSISSLGLDINARYS